MTLSRLPTRCKQCRTKFTPEERARAMVLHPDCIGPWADAYQAKKRAAEERKRKAQAKVERARTRQEKEIRKTLPDLHKEARYWFNRWIRLRDADKPCVSCGKPPPDMSGLHAGRDCGHFRSVGSAGHLRYTEDNAAAQCVHCNQYLAGNYTGFRKGQLVRIGVERVEELENDNAPEKWQRDQVRGIRDDYKARCKQLEKEQA